MIFIETTIFTRLHKDYFTDDTYRALQNFLMESPGAGDVIQGAGGIRKIRWGCGNKGKRSGMNYLLLADEGRSNLFPNALCKK